MLRPAHLTRLARLLVLLGTCLGLLGGALPLRAACCGDGEAYADEALISEASRASAASDDPHQDGDDDCGADCATCSASCACCHPSLLASTGWVVVSDPVARPAHPLPMERGPPRRDPDGILQVPKAA